MALFCIFKFCIIIIIIIINSINQSINIRLLHSCQTATIDSDIQCENTHMKNNVKK